MPVYHRSQRLQIIGETVDVTQLFGDRYRIVVRCRAAHDTEAWYEANKDEIFADFGTLYNAPMDVDGISSRTGEAYPNMALVSNVAGASGGEYVVTFVYETLTDAWVQEQEDQVDSTENGFRLLTRTEVSSINTAAPYDEDDVGVSTITDGGKTLYLSGLQDQTKTQPDAQIGRIVTKWQERGVISISPTDNNFSLAQSYTYTTSGIAASDMTGLKTPSGVALTADVTWFEPSVQFPSGFPTYTQTVLLKVIPASETDVKIDSTQQFFNVTDPGVMNCDFTWESGAESGSSSVWPKADSLPETYRKKGTVDVYLSSIATFTETEVAYSEENVQWCSIAFSNIYASEETSAASSSGSWRSFPGYLNSPETMTPGTTREAEASILGKYYSIAKSYGSGDTTFTTSGIFRVEVQPYIKATDGSQLYLKTIVTFS